MKALSLVAAALLIAAAGWLALSYEPAPAVAPRLPDQFVEKELKQDQSQEFMRTHVRDAKGRELQTLIRYRDGSYAEVTYHDNKKKASYKKFDKSNFNVENLKFADDGKTVVGGVRHRADHTLFSKVEQDPSSGVITTRVYWWEGTSLFQKLDVQPDGKYSTEYFHRNGQRWQEQSGFRSGALDFIKEYRNGTLVRMREEQSWDSIVTYYRPDATVANVVQFRKDHYFDWEGRQEVRFIDEFAADGTTKTRSFTVSPSGRQYGVRVVIFLPNGDRIVRELRPDFSVKHEDLRPASGPVINEKDFATSDLKEPIDEALLVPPSLEDPVAEFNQMERDPTRRDREP